MRKIFHKWLLINMAAVFALTFGLVFWHQSRELEDDAATIIRLKLDDAQNQLSASLRNSANLRDVTDNAALSKARAFAEILRLDPGLAHDRKRLEQTRQMLDVNELNICDANGIIIASTHPDLIGYDMNSAPQSQAFMPAIKDKGFALAQAPTPRGKDGEPYQYAGVSRHDAPGIAQVGYFAARMHKTMDIAGLENLSGGFRIGSGGSVLLFENGRVTSASRPGWIGKTLADYGIQGQNIPALGSLGEEFWLKGPQGEFLCITGRYANYIIAGLLPEHEVYVERTITVVYMVLASLALFTVIFVLVSWLLNNVVITGIHQVNASLGKITTGDFNEIVSVAGNPEFASLSGSINSMVSALREAAAAEKRHMEREMALARAIQLGSLPDMRAALPCRQEFDLSACMFAAREVGGDFYDFFLIDQNHLGLVIADVAGKGIPAALFMMTSKAHLKNIMLVEKDLAVAAGVINNILCQNNRADMFFTCFAAVLNLKTGKLHCINAGHNAPLLAEKDGAPYTPLETPRNFVIGGMENIQYTAATLCLSPGARLFLYTDGVTEATNTASELYGEKRLRQVINTEELRGLSPQKLLAAIKESVDQFTLGTEQQADDITMLALAYGKEAE